MRGLTALGLKLGSAFGKTEDVLDADRVSGLAGSHVFFFFSIKRKIDYIVWREVFL